MKHTRRQARSRGLPAQPRPVQSRALLLALVASQATACSRSLRHPGDDYPSSPPAPRVAVDRRCEAAKPDTKEHCTLAGNPVTGEVNVIDMYHLRITLRLGQTVSGCGQIDLTTTLLFPSGAPQQASATVECRTECMPDGPGGGTCWHVPHGDFGFDLELSEPLPYFRTDGTSTAGVFSLRVTSGGGHLQPTEVMVRTPEQPPRYGNEPSADPTCVPRARQEVCYYRYGSQCGAVPSGCPGTTIPCGCDWGLSCQDGICMPEHPTCDPVGPQDACIGDVCGQVSAGCPGVFVQCECPSGLTCENGRCRK